jgi:hypothetical protein
VVLVLVPDQIPDRSIIRLADMVDGKPIVLWLNLPKARHQSVDYE